MVDFSVEKKSVADHFIVTIVSEPQRMMPEQPNEQQVQRIDELPMHVPVRHMSIDENSPLLRSSHHMHSRPPLPNKSRWLRLWKCYKAGR
jgi:hypothetical protein